MTERDQLARDIFLKLAGANTGRTTESSVQTAIELAAVFFDAIEDRREATAPNGNQSNRAARRHPVTA